MRRGHIAVMTGDCGTDIVGDSASNGKSTKLVVMISSVGTSSIKCMAIFISSYHMRFAYELCTDV